MRVSESTSDTSTETERVSDRARKNWPTTPERKPSGASTTTVVRVEPTTGAISSRVASSIACSPRPPPPADSRRWMFSTITTASSITRPMATARPPIDIRLIDSPNSFMNRKVASTVSGRVIEAIRVTRQSRRKRRSTSTARAPPIRMASRTLAMAVATNSARS
jgi:hypothetical protein